ncbi:MAG: HAMP domain-containing protein [Trueperaceae bacterium]|nr:HAMP domain-containing protein [Trueperaceae bacterium]
MDAKYIVNVREPPGANREQLAANLAEEFRVDDEKALGLLARMPGPVTKPIDRAQAERTAERFRNAGLEPDVQRVGEAPPPEPAPAKPEPAEPRPARETPEPAPQPARQPAQKPAQQSSQQPAQKPARRERSEASPSPATARTRRSTSLRNKFLLTSIVPALLVLGLAIGAILLTIPGALRGQLLESARNPAIAFANSISGLLGPQDLSDPDVVVQLQATLNASRESFREQEVSFILVTDPQGNQLAGWYEGASDTEGIPPVLRTAIQSQARRAVARAYIDRVDIELGTTNPPSRRIEAEGDSIEVTGQAIEQAGQSTGAVVIGISSAVIDRRVNEVLYGTLVIGIVPILIAIFIAVRLVRGLTSGIDYLIRAADRISRGKFDEPVELASSDELGELSRAIERMRISLQEGIERLRRRRR